MTLALSRPLSSGYLLKYPVYPDLFGLALPAAILYDRY